MIFSILSIDDELDMQDLLLQKFRRKIRNKEIKLFFALNGKDGLDILNANPNINMVLADINMPIMDGLTFLSEVEKINRPLLHVIMISAYGDMKNIRLAMNRGAFDFINKPIDFKDLESTINKTKTKIEVLASQQKEVDRLLKLENEIKAAADIQSSILPKINGIFKNYKSVNIGSLMKPAKYVGGDLYDVYELDEHRIGFVIADVSGKGIAAAAFMLMSTTAINIYAHMGLPANEVMQRTNDFLCEDNDESMFTTTFYGIFNTQTGVLNYSNAGHNPPLLFRDSKCSELESTLNPALGVIPNVEYGTKEVQINSSDFLLMFTDGVSEAQNTDNEEYQLSSMSEVVRLNNDKSPEEINKALFDSLELFRGEAAQFDDITMLSFKWNA